MRVDCLIASDDGWLDHAVYGLGVMGERVGSGEATAVTVVLERRFSDTAVDRRAWRFARSVALRMMEDVFRAEYTGDDRGGDDYRVFPMLDGTRVLLTELGRHGASILIPADGLKRMLADVLGVSADPSAWIDEEEEDIPWDDDEEESP